jgi:biopolymer transport protein ExbB
MNLLLFLQAATANELPVLTGTGEQASTAPQSLSFFNMALQGGWLMIPLLILLFLALYIFFERSIVIHKASKEDRSFMNRIKDYLLDGKTDSALKLCKQTNTPSSRLIEKGITRIGRPMNDVQIAIENVGNIEVSKLEKGMPILASVAGGAPMIGFLGTVLGMVQAFFDMSTAGSNIDISILSAGIYVAMVTTVAGLIVGISAYFAYNYLASRVKNIVTNLETKTMEFMDVLHEPTKA